MGIMQYKKRNNTCSRSLIFRNENSISFKTVGVSLTSCCIRLLSE